MHSWGSYKINKNTDKIGVFVSIVRYAPACSVVIARVGRDGAEQSLTSHSYGPLLPCAR